MSWTDQWDSLAMEITWGDTKLFSIMVYNKEPIAMTYKLWFVDGAITSDAFSHKVCLSTLQDTQVGKYITWDTLPFTLAPWATWAKTLSVTFPKYYSGMYHGCVTLFPITASASTEVDTIPRRGVFLDALVHGNSFPFVVKAFPSNRIYQTNNNTNSGIVRFYDTNRNFVAESLPVTLNERWTGETVVSVPAGTYYVAFKWQSHLASYLSGVTTLGVGDDIFDFTTGANLYGTQQINSEEDDGKRYQSAGDLKNAIGVYDFMINGNDIAIITTDGLQEGWISILDPKNLNGDWSINASDISVIGVNFEKTDPFFDGIFTW